MSAHNITFVKGCTHAIVFSQAAQNLNNEGGRSIGGQPVQIVAHIQTSGTGHALEQSFSDGGSPFMWQEMTSDMLDLTRNGTSLERGATKKFYGAGKI